MKNFLLTFLIFIDWNITEDITIELNQKPLESIEFVANYEKEPYLAALEENDKSYLDLFNLQKDLMNSDFSNDPIVQYCPRNLLNSFDVNSYLVPVQKPEVITECPNMK